MCHLYTEIKDHVAGKLNNVQFSVMELKHFCRFSVKLFFKNYSMWVFEWETVITACRLPTINLNSFCNKPSHYLTALRQIRTNFLKLFSCRSNSRFTFRILWNANKGKRAELSLWPFAVFQGNSQRRRQWGRWWVRQWWRRGWRCWDSWPPPLL